MKELKRNKYRFQEINYFKLKYFSNSNFHYRAKILSKEESDIFN